MATTETRNPDMTVDEAAARVEELEAELASLPDKIREARRAVDVESYLRLENRAEDLEKELPAARRQLALARVRESEEDLKVAQAEDHENRRRLREEHKRADAALAEAERAVREAGQARLAAYGAMQSYTPQSHAVAAELKERREEARRLGVALTPDDVEGLTFGKSVILTGPDGEQIQFGVGDPVPTWVVAEVGLDSHLFDPVEEPEPDDGGPRLRPSLHAPGGLELRRA